MENIGLSLFLAKAWGLFIVILCSALLVNKKHVLSLAKDYRDDVLLLFSGVILTMLGVVHVLSYNFWTFDYRGIITFLGWAMLFKGTVRLFFPSEVKSFVKKIADQNWYGALLVIFLFVGFYLLFVGFGSY